MVAATELDGREVPLRLARDAQLRRSPRSTGRFADLEQRVPSLDLNNVPQVRVASGRLELLAAYRLVHRRYAERGLVRREPDGILYSPEFARGDSRTFVTLSEKGEVTATATLLGEPPLDAAPDAIIPWRTIRASDPRRRLAGVTCLAAADSACGPKPAAFFALSRFLFQYARHCNYDGLAIVIHPRQLRFYGRICPIVPLGETYRQAKLGNSLAVPCRIDLDSSALANVAPSVLSWFESPIVADELNQPGIGPLNNAFLIRYAKDNDRRAPSHAVPRLAVGS